MSAAALLLLIAQAPKRTVPFLRKSEDWVVVGLLAGALLAGAVILHYFERWRKSGLTSTRDAASDLTDYRAMFERGEITRPEYEALRAKVAGRAKPAPPPAPPNPAPDAPPAPPGEQPPPA